MFKIKSLALAALLPIAVSAAPAPATIQINYTDFTIWLDCNKHGAVKFQYNTRPDNGVGIREPNFTFDANVPKQCQQTSTKTYGGNYDRGHLVPENHLDYSVIAMREANHITNILPQTSTMNRGAWLLTEEIIECYRDNNSLTVIGGPVWGTNKSNDLFVKSHGVETPDSFWKVILNNSTGTAIAWIVPNTFDATRAKLDSYLVPISYIEQITGFAIPTTAENKYKILSQSWYIPRGCNKS
jgi:endonuclease G